MLSMIMNAGGKSSSFLATTVPPVTSVYKGVLSAYSPVFVRLRSSGSSSYYQAIRISVSVNGTYTFTSYGTINTYGYFYTNSVDPSDPTANLVTSGVPIDGQFSLDVYLYDGSSYFLIVTTYDTDIVGSFAIIATGPSTVDMSTFTPSTSRPITTRTTSEWLCSDVNQSVSYFAWSFCSRE